MPDPLIVRGNSLVEELIAWKAMLLRAGIKEHAIRNMRPLAIPVGEAHRFQREVGSDQPKVKIGARCELMGINVIICDDLERLF